MVEEQRECKALEEKVIAGWGVCVVVVVVMVVMVVVVVMVAVVVMVVMVMVVMVMVMMIMMTKPARTYVATTAHRPCGSSYRRGPCSLTGAGGAMARRASRARSI